MENGSEKKRQCVCFTAVNPMDENRFPENARYDLRKSSNCSAQKCLGNHQNTVCWCNLKLAHKRGLQFCQTQSHAIVFFDTLPAICIEKVVYWKTGEEFFQSLRIPTNTAYRPQMIFLKKMRDNLPTNKAKETCRTENHVAAPWITGFKVFHNL